ncbi:MAG: histidinol-phosphate transaminase [Chloroflexota bacterium]|nr:histidinol-phosphate transaminase [Chloroflexota bacterium]
MTFSPEKMVRAHIEPVRGYTPGASPAMDPSAIRLDWNESPFGLSPKAQAVYDSFRSGNRYPDFSQSRLTHALAAYVETTADRIVAGAGLDDVFTTTAITLIDPGDEVIISDPTFGVYRSLFGLHGATMIDVPLGPAPDFTLDAEGIVAAVSDRTKLIIICNPNNPTGTMYEKGCIERIVSRVRCVVAIDEAYAEFSGTTHLDLADHYPNVILFRTMSKFAGLAGYRVGYGVFPEALLPWIRRAAPAFYNLSAIATEVAIASLDDLEHVRNNVALLISERGRLQRELNAMPGVQAYHSAANFLLMRLPVDDATAVHEALARDRVFVRRFADPGYGLRQCLRVSIGTPDQNDAFLHHLQTALGSATTADQFADSATA